jgi:hypothetical protein
MTKSAKIISLAIALLLFAIGFWAYNGYLDRSFQRIEKDDSGQPVQMIFLKTGSVFPGYAQDQVVRLILTNDFATPRAVNTLKQACSFTSLAQLLNLF